jgi:hypothetical protein
VARCLVGHEPDLSTGGLAIVDGRTLRALLRPADLAAIAPD